MILFVGPTGSGKSTTMYSLTKYCAENMNRHVISLEDPVENSQSHLLQIQVNERSGVTYAKGLKAILRHSPDVIYINYGKMKLGKNDGGNIIIKEFIVKQVEIKHYLKKDIKKVYTTFICKKTPTGIYLPHFISKYIHINFANASLNTQKKYAEEIKKFLNYVYSEILSEELRSKGIRALTLKDGVSYLNSIASNVISGSIKYETYNYSHKVIANFFLWLSENKLIDEEISTLTKSSMVNGERSEIKISPFVRLDLGLIIIHKKRRTKYNTRLHDFGIHRKDLISLFLKVAEVEAPDIVVGLLLQMYGGLRIGELLNLRYTDINIKDTGSHMPITFIVQDRWKEIFEGKKNIHLEQIKTEREQIVINSTFIRDYFNKYLKVRKDRVEIKSSALIINSKNYEAMRTQAYRYRFEKVKRKFLEIVKYTSEEDYVYLTSKPWSTHIGRGIYTNILTYEMSMDASATALARGDLSTESAATYIEKAENEHKLKEAMKILDEIHQKRQR